MKLTLKVRSFCDQPATDTNERSFSTFPVIVGRSNSCDYVLSDVSRYISSNHAAFTLEDNKLIIQDTSANGVYLNGSNESIGRGGASVIANGDTISIGDYCINISLRDSRQQDPGDPFADFNDSADTPPNAEPYDPFRGADHDWTPASRDPFDLDADDAAAAKPGVGIQRESDWADWKRSTDEPASQANDDLDWLPGASSPTKPAHNPPPPRPSNRPVATPDRRQRAHQAAPQVQHSNVLGSFYRAAKLDERDFSSRSADDVMQQSGKLLNLAIEGMMMLLQSRSEMKNAMRSDVTLLSKTDNNPLKFSYSAEDALTKLLSDNNRGGYLESEQAMRQALEDLKIHQIAMLEGMKAAVKALLLEFDPETLASTLERTHPVAATIPITRDAKLWQMFRDQYGEIRDEAVNDFGEMFGREFRKAYEKRIQELGRKPDF